MKNLSPIVHNLNRLSFIFFFLFGYSLQAQIPANYYNSAIGLTGSALKQELHNIITTGHSVVSYSGLWTAYGTTDRDTHFENDNTILDMYSENPTGTDPYNFTYSTNQCGTYAVEGDCYNREHTVPQSWFGGTSPMYSDLFHIFPTDGKVNGMRSNYPYGEVTSPTWTSQNGSKLGPCTYPGYTGTVFEPIDEFKGDIARAYFYMATRYKDETTGWSGGIFTAGGGLVSWALNMFYEWHIADPPSAVEIDRNNDVYDKQYNANPYIDHPEWVCEVWFSGTCSTTPALAVAPSSLTGMTYIFGNGPSAVQSFNLSGTNLTGYPSYITATAPTNFEVCLTSGGTYTSSVDVAYSSASLSTTPIYVRLKSALSVNTYSGSVSITGGGDTDGASVSVSGSVTAAVPTLYVTRTSLSGFTYVAGAGPSAEQTYDLSGVYLTGFPSNITVTAPTNFEVSLTTGAGFAGSVNVAYSSATLSTTTIYVRLKSGLSAGTYGPVNITNSGGGAATVNVAVSGTVINGSGNCGTETFTNIPASSSTYSTITWTGDNGGTWESTLARTDLTINGKAICFKGYSLSPSLSGGIGDLTVTTKYPYSDGTSTLSVEVNGVVVGTIPISTILQTTTLFGINVSGNIQVKISSDGSKRAAIDDLSWTCYTPGTPSINVSPTILSGFTYILGSGPSPEQSFTISGTNLTDNIIITPLSNYEISTTTGPLFVATNPITLTHSGGTVTNTSIYVRLKSGLSAGIYNSEIITASSTDASDKTVICNGSVTTVPTIDVNGTLPDFGTLCVGSTSTQQSYTVSGSNLTANITINAPTGFKISTTSGIAYTNTLTLTQSGGTVTPTTIYAIFQPTAYNIYSTFIAHNSNGAVSQEQIVSGTGIQGALLSTGTINSITTFSASSGGNITSNEGSAVTERGVCWNTSANPTITNFKTIDGSGTGSYTSSLTGLSSGTSYYVRAYATNSCGTVYGNELSFVTLKGEPSNHATGLNCGSSTAAIIQFSWTDASGGILPDKYLIVCNTSGIFTDPIDGVEQTDIAGSIMNVNQGVQTASFTGLLTNTSYYFKIFPYTNTGADINYKTDGFVLTGNCSTIDGPCLSADFNSGTVPSGWIETGMVYNTNGSCDATNQAVFNATGDYLVTNVLNYPNSLTFTYRRSSNATAWSMKVQISSSTSGPWADIQTISDALETCKTATLDLSPYSYQSGLYIRFIDTRGSGANERYLDNVEVYCISVNDADSEVSASSALNEPTMISSLIDSNGEEVAVFDFTFTDVGTLGDGIPTIIDGLTIKQGTGNDISNWTNAIAGAYLIGPDLGTPLAGTVNTTNITFTGNDMISVANGFNETYTLKIYLKTDLSGITDNNNLVFKLNYSDITTDPSGSSFGSGAPESGSLNVAVDIVATQLLFVQQPISTQINLSMSPNPSVKACDVNGNVDADYSVAVSVTSTGLLAGSPVPGTWASGLAVFLNLTHTAIGTNLTITATSGSLGNCMSIPFNISEFNFLTGDVRPLIAGTDFGFSGTTPYYWEEFDGTNWNNRSVSPESSKPLRVIVNRSSITGGNNTSNTYNDIIIVSGGELILNGWTETPSSVFIAADKSLEVQSGGVLRVQGNFDMTSTSNLWVRNGGVMYINEPNMDNAEEMWNGKENFEPGSLVQYDDWQWSVSATNRSIMNVITQISDNLSGYKFGHIVVNIPSSITNDFTIVGGGITANICSGNLTVNNASASYYAGMASNTGSVIININGNLIVNSGNFNFGTLFTGTASTNQTVNINGNFEYNGAGALKLHRTAGGTLSSTTSTLNVKGDIKIGSCVGFTNDNAVNLSKMILNFNGTSNQNIDITPIITNIPSVIKGGSIVSVNGTHLQFDSNSPVTVESSGVFQINPSKSCTINGLLTNYAGTTGMVIKSDASGTGSLIHTSSDIAATCERYLTANIWHFIFSPLNNALISQLTTIPSVGENPNFYFYDETVADYWNGATLYTPIGWTYPNSNLDPLSTNYGYIHQWTDPLTYTLSGGVLTATDKTFTLSYSNNNALPFPEYVAPPVWPGWDKFDGWNLVGNPYASAIDLDNTGITKTNIDNFVYYYDDSQEKYLCYGNNPGLDGSGFAINGGSRYIPANQAVMVKAYTDGGTLFIPTSARVHHNQGLFKEEPKNIMPDLLRFQIEKDGYTDETVIRTLADATFDHDPLYDAHKLFSWNPDRPQIYTNSNLSGSLFAVNSLPEITTNRVVPIGLKLNESGIYTIRFTENSFENMHIWLEDALLNQTMNVLNDTVYTISQISEHNENRFFIHFELNTAPMANIAIPDQETLKDEPYSYQLPENTFIDNDFEDVLNITASLETGEALPLWLGFIPEANCFKGIPDEIQTLNIRLTATDIFGAKAFNDFVLNVKNFVSVNTIYHHVSIYPNPTNNQIFIESEGISDGEITITDVNGREILKSNLMSHITIIDLSKHVKGIYFVKIISDIGCMIQKVILK